MSGIRSQRTNRLPKTDATVGCTMNACHNAAMQSPRNPTRRNRNIGTAAQGHGQDNVLVIPNRADGLHWLDRIDRYSLEDRIVSGRSVRFIIEETTGNCVHPCTISDVVHVLQAIPASDWAGLATFVFRQPTRKQLALSPVWGRLAYAADITTSKGKVLSSGPTIYLEAVDVGKSIIWSTSLDPDDLRELDRLRADGHIVKRAGGKQEIIVTPQSARNTQLYRTLLHEIGHWFDWLSKVEEPLARGEDFDALHDAYFARPRPEREAFAHRYADALRARLEQIDTIPFS